MTVIKCHNTFMINQELSIEYQLLDGLSAEEFPYDELKGQITGEMVERYLAPIVAYTVGHEAQVALEVAASTGTIEGFEVIETAFERQDDADDRRWAVGSKIGSLARRGKGITGEVIIGANGWFTEEITVLRNSAVRLLGPWHKSAEEKNTRLSVWDLSGMHTIYNQAVDEELSGASYLKEHYPEIMDIVR